MESVIVAGAGGGKALTVPAQRNLVITAECSFTKKRTNRNLAGFGATFSLKPHPPHVVKTYFGSCRNGFMAFVVA